MQLLIVDDDALVRDSLKRILEAKGFAIAATGKSGEEAVALYETHRPDILLMDIRMEGIGGLGATRAILQKYPDAKILLITTFQDDEYIAQAIDLGCSGYILKQNIAGIVPAIEAVGQGQLVYDSRIVTKLAGGTRAPQLPPDLSAREKDILLLVAEGLSNREIAEKLYLSEGTVRNYVSGLLEKLELRDRTQLAIYYYKTR